MTFSFEPGSRPGRFCLVQSASRVLVKITLLFPALPVSMLGGVSGDIDMATPFIPCTIMDAKYRRLRHVPSPACTSSRTVLFTLCQHGRLYPSLKGSVAMFSEGYPC